MTKANNPATIIVILPRLFISKTLPPTAIQCFHDFTPNLCKITHALLHLLTEKIHLTIVVTQRCEHVILLQHVEVMPDCLILAAEVDTKLISIQRLSLDCLNYSTPIHPTPRTSDQPEQHLFEGTGLWHE